MLRTGHTYGILPDKMNIIKRKHLNTSEKCHIYKISKIRLHIND
jgi:hypothetical protein